LHLLASLAEFRIAILLLLIYYFDMQSLLVIIVLTAIVVLLGSIPRGSGLRED
jgi:H+/gluconate symporter-like permease